MPHLQKQERICKNHKILQTPPGQIPRRHNVFYASLYYTLPHTVKKFVHGEKNLCPVKKNPYTVKKNFFPSPALTFSPPVLNCTLTVYIFTLPVQLSVFYGRNLSMITRKFRSALCGLLTLLLCFTILTPMLPARAASYSDKKLIAITFDDGPSNNTPVLLDGLEERGAVATFFMCGANGSHGVVKHSDLLPRMVRLGCQLANHSYTHPSFTKLSGDQMGSEIAKVEPYIYEAVGGEYLDLVRIPGGSNTDRIRANVPHPMIRWSIDPLDWRDRDEEIVYQRIMEKAHDGGVILLHDLYPTSIAAGLRAIDSLREQGYEFVTVSELFRRRGIYLENGAVYNNAPSGENAVTKPRYTAPSISTESNAKTGETTVAIWSDEIGVSSIHYTTDGSMPTLASPLYTEPFTVLEDTFIRAAGFDRFATRTPLNERTVRPGTAMPKIAGVSKGKLELSCETEGAKILYSTDGSDPRVNGTLYTRAFTPGTVTRAVAVVGGRARSDVAQFVKMSDGSIFADVSPDAWYYPAVNDVVQRGYMGSVGDYRFAPAASVTRAAMVSILYRMEGSPEVNGSNTFQDVPAGVWYADAVTWAAENNIVSGTTPATFEPAQALTRQQAAVIIRRYTAWAGKQGGEPALLSSYEDGYDVSPYAEEAMAWCAGNGLFHGLSAGGYLAPKEDLVRAHCAYLISVLHQIRMS